MKNKKFISLLIIISIMLNILISPIVANALTPRPIPGFHPQDIKTIQFAIHQQAYSRWDDTLGKWVHDHFNTTYVNPEIALLISQGYDDQTPQDGSNEFNKDMKDVEPTHKPDGTPNVYMAYEADYWGYFVLYAPDVPLNGKVTVKYVDVDNLIPVAISDVYNNVTPGEHQYSYKPVTGYDLAPGENSIKSVNVTAGGEHTITFKYKQIPIEGAANVVVRYVDESDNDITSANTYSYKKSEFGVKSFTAPQTIGTYNINGIKTQSVDVKEEKTYTISFKYKKSLAPTATISAPSIVTLGDDVYLYGRGSSEDETVKSMGGYIYIDGGSGIEGDNPIDAEERDGQSINISGTVYFTQLKTYYAQTSVWDSNGRTAQSEIKAIKVVNPEPSVRLTKSGKEKENRKIIIDASESYSGSQRSGLKWDKVIWKFEGVDGSNANDVRVQTHTIGSTNGTVLLDSSKGINGTFASIKTIDVLYKKAGKYKITCTLENNYGMSDTESIILTIEEDKPPISDFSFPENSYRDPSNLANGLPQFITEVTDQSYSPDGDIIVKRGLIVSFDTDNNSAPGKTVEDIYSNENWYIFDLSYNGVNQIVSAINPSYIEYSQNPHLKKIGTLKDVERKDIIDNVNTGNDQTWLIKSTHVGHMYILVVVKEEFGQDTIPQFVTIADRKVSVFYE